MIKAPFTPEQVVSLNQYQQSGRMHPFTCGNEHGEPRDLIATPAGWVCGHPSCGYTQDWAHQFMADGSWGKP